MKHVWLLAAFVVVAGCVSSGDPTSTGTSPSATVSTPAPGADTGGIKVTVTTTELEPVTAAQVVLADTEFSVLTDNAGVAQFTGLNPGSYTVLAAKPGYQSVQDKGRLVDVLAGEESDVKLTLDPVPVINAQNSYHTTLPFTGFMSCGVEGEPGRVLGRSTPCGQWLNPGGIQVGDPNHKTRFPWSIESLEILGIVVEAEWQPTTGVSGQQLRAVITHQIDCAATCLWQNAILTFGGPSPLQGSVLEGADHRITKRLGEDPAQYPRTVYAEMGAYCQTNCTGAQVVFQQDFDMWVTAFYGSEPPAAFSARQP